MDTSISQETIDQVKAAHPGLELHVLSAPLSDGDIIEVIAKRPTPGEWTRFRSMMSDDAQRAMAQKTLTCACVVYPSPTEFQAMLQTRPGLGDTFSKDLVELAGISAGVTRRKV